MRPLPPLPPSAASAREWGHWPPGGVPRKNNLGRKALGSVAAICVLGGLAVAVPASAAETPASGSTALLGLLASDQPSPVIDDVALNIGADDRQRNLAWFSTSGVDEQVQVAPASAVTKKQEFPVDAATSIAATGGAAYDTTSSYRHATLTQLAANKQYVYRVGSHQGGWSEAYTFTTAGRNGNFNFLFMGDVQIGSSGNVAGDTAGWESTLDTAFTAFPGSDFILSAGDQVNTAGNEAQYDGFFAPEQLTSIPKDQAFPFAAVQNQDRAANYSNVEVSENALTLTTYRSSDSSVVDEVTLTK
ncbi:MAG: metallophosphoesterase [Cryobacterium sp.]|nr:metallophosphoesterase [Cryobacterium sp.]